MNALGDLVVRELYSFVEDCGMIRWKTTSFSLNTIRVIKGGILQRNKIQNFPLRFKCCGPHFGLRETGTARQSLIAPGSRFSRHDVLSDMTFGAGILRRMWLDVVLVLQSCSWRVGTTRPV